MIRDNSMKKILNYMVCAYILSYALPSGIIAGLPVQKVLVVAVFVCTLILFAMGKYVTEIICNSVYEIVIAVIGMIWCIVSWHKGVLFSFDVFILLYVGAVILLELKYLLKYEMLNINMVMQCVYYMLLAKIVIKLVMEASFIAGILDYDGVSQFYLHFFSTGVTTMTMDLGKVELVRIQESSDAIVFTLIPFYWFMPERGRGNRIVLILAMAVYTLLVFSRIYIAEFTGFVLITIIYYWKKISHRQKITGIVFLLMAMVLFSKPMLEVFKFRFFSSFTVESDIIRIVQMKELWKGVMDSPWIGHGMGSFLSYYIRSERFPFSYELEYLSFLYQFGIVGFILIIFGIIGIYLKHIYPYLKKNSYVLNVLSVVGTGWFLIRPLLNPSFLGKQNQFLLIGIFLLNAWYDSKKNARE